MRRRKNRTQRLSEAEQQFRAAFDLAPIGMALVRPSGEWLQVNPRLCEILGRAEDAIMATTRQELTHPDDVPLNLHLAGELLSGVKERFEMHKRYLHGDGHWVWVNLSVSLVRDRDAKPLYFIAQVQDISEQRRMREQLARTVDHDALTGALNRRGLEDELSRHVQLIRSYGPEGALLVLDLDRFKYVNDSRGHVEGDRVLVEVATAIRENLTPNDTLARLGGDEFAILLPRADRDEACRTAEALIHGIRTRVSPGGDLLPLAASVGIVPFDTAETDVQQALVDAELAMYDAKESGRGRWAFAGVSGSHSRMQERVGWIEEICAAIRNDRLELFAQPIVGVDDGTTRLFELLLRLRHSDGSLIPPAAFLDIAERFDLIRDVDRWVVRAAAEIVESDTSGSVAVAVNLSGKSIADPAFLDFMEGELSRRTIDPQRLVFEITETAAVTDLAAARRFATVLRELGYRIALDDFGSGFGTFAYLKHLPFDILKIDGEFVKGAVESPEDQVIIDAVVQIARGLGKVTIAEWVENEETLSLLRDAGVELVQGYHLGRPQPVAEAIACVPRAERGSVTAPEQTAPTLA